MAQLPGRITPFRTAYVNRTGDAKAGGATTGASDRRGRRAPERLDHFRVSDKLLIVGVDPTPEGAARLFDRWHDCSETPMLPQRRCGGWWHGTGEATKNSCSTRSAARQPVWGRLPAAIVQRHGSRCL